MSYFGTAMEYTCIRQFKDYDMYRTLTKYVQVDAFEDFTMDIGNFTLDSHEVGATAWTFLANILYGQDLQAITHSIQWYGDF